MLFIIICHVLIILYKKVKPPWVKRYLNTESSASVQPLPRWNKCMNFSKMYTTFSSSPVALAWNYPPKKILNEGAAATINWKDFRIINISARQANIQSYSYVGMWVAHEFEGWKVEKRLISFWESWKWQPSMEGNCKKE